VIKGKTLRHTLDKFLKNSEVAKEARVQVCLPNGEFYDITGMQLMENKLLGNRESHRLIITIDKEKMDYGPSYEKNIMYFKESNDFLTIENKKFINEKILSNFFPFYRNFTLTSSKDKIFFYLMFY
jgi:hypothetical protein